MSTTTTRPEDELDRAIALAGTRCGVSNATGKILGSLDPYSLDVENMGISGEDSNGTAYILDGLLAMPNQIESVSFNWYPFTDADPDMAKLHSRLFFNDRRTTAFFFLAMGGSLEASPTSVWTDPSRSTAFAEWNADEIAYNDGTSEPFILPDLLRSPNPDSAVSDLARDEMWGRIQELVNQIQPMVETLDWTQLSDLADIDQAELTNLVCIAVATEYQRYIDLEVAELQADPTHIYPFLAAQNLQLVTEYMSVITEHMERPNVDWLNAPDINTTLDPDGTTSDAEYLVIWQSGINKAISETRFLLAPEQ